MIGMSTLASAGQAKKAAETKRKSDFSGRQKDANRKAVLSFLTGAGAGTTHLPFIGDLKDNLQRRNQG